MTHITQQQARRLSGGLRRRLHLATALAHRVGRATGSQDNEAITGGAAGLSYVALPPDETYGLRAAAPLIITWHLNDPPRSAAAMAAALPLSGVAAWRVLGCAAVIQAGDQSSTRRRNVRLPI